MTATRNFGFRSTENIVRESRLKTADTHRLGAPVVADAANAGQLKAAIQTTAASPLAGILWYEAIQYKGVDGALSVPADLDTVGSGQYAQVVRGPGVKVWFHNTSAKTLADGRVVSAVTVVKGVGSLAIGDTLCPNEAADVANGLWREAVPGTDPEWLTVTSVNTSTGYVEARFNF
jgi:hypothetical protein